MNFLSIFKKKKKKKGIRDRRPCSLFFNVSCLVLLQHCFLSLLRDANFCSGRSEFSAERLFLRKAIFSD